MNKAALYENLLKNRNHGLSARFSREFSKIFNISRLKTDFEFIQLVKLIKIVEKSVENVKKYVQTVLFLV